MIFGNRESCVGGTYEVGPTNSVVYPVHGGMEEWGYAGSWFNQLNDVQTVPTSCNAQNISVEMTNCSNRCVTFLIEATDAKIPPESALGESGDLWKFTKTNRTDYVNVILRQSLVLIDVIRPYSLFETVQIHQNKLNITWMVGGCFEVDSTKILVFSMIPEWVPILSSGGFDTFDLTDEEYQVVQSVLETQTPLVQSSEMQGVSSLRFNPVRSLKLSDPSNQMHFQTTLSLPCENCMLVAVSHVDSYMRHSPLESNPRVPPQSHYAQMHSNDTYQCYDKKSQRMIRGRHTLFSRPFVVSIAEDMEVKMVLTENRANYVSVVYGWIVIDCVVILLLVLVCLAWSVC